VVEVDQRQATLRPAPPAPVLQAVGLLSSLAVDLLAICSLLVVLRLVRFSVCVVVQLRRITGPVWLIRLCTEPSYHPGLSPHELELGCRLLLLVYIAT
jgi:hypothetical protein